ncbi:hypothetical protein CLV59_10153 [Chitinophaga dinghuensis]|uniref:Uncharacterized protein n=1 Tax=Chitinophaga dinghuensis TaxID=1539050 RepID=A0A327WHV0_9BACT|nr:hypothetical protein [Chitinophaga dinghuensis]RAJ87304.1 hypothetical protein CLV59_10153 [Chitinophaga dinghuensis]
MKIHFKSLLLPAFPVMLLLAVVHKSSAAIPLARVNNDTCLVKTESNYEFPDSLRKKIHDLVEDKIGGGIDEKGIATWENSPDAPEYYQVILRKNKLFIKYKGIVCQDKLIWENVKSCQDELKKLLNK